MQAGRKLFVGGNWKSNGVVSSVTNLVNNYLNPARIDFNKVDVVVSPMFVHLPLVQSILRPEIKVASQNASSTPAGPYTGEVTADSIRDLGISWVILGHSERRSFYGESDAIVSVKVKRALNADLNVIACIGENLKERESGVTNDVITRQLEALKSSIQDWKRVVIAYEPVWAIGTGVSASPVQAQDTHKVIRDWISKEVGTNESQNVRVIYGGSVTDVNSDELIAQKDIDGFLVGGASLKPAFIRIIESCMH
jgi:triosephosphate isomerase